MTDAHEATEDSEREQRRTQLGRLILVVAVAVTLSIATGSFPTLAVLAAVIAMIMLHELGHFITAKLGGMKVTEYFLGFGPRVWSIRRGGTEYGVKVLPLGGYVKIPGMTNLEEVDPADEPRTYRQQSFPRRMAVAVGGSFMHFLIAFVLLMVVWVGVGKLDDTHPTRTIGSISRVQGGASPAQAAGMRVGDEIVAVDGKALTRWDDLRAYIRARPAQRIVFTVQRGGRRLDLTAVPTDINPAGEKVGFIGIGPGLRRKTVGFFSAVSHSAHDFGDNVVLTAKGLASFFSPGRLNNYGDQLLGNRPKAGSGNDTRFLSPVDIVRVSGQAADSGALAVLAFLIGLNIGVGVFNLIPLLPLDGGHVAIAVYERIRSRRGRPYHADVAKLMPVTFAVVGVLIVIVVSSLWLSITHPLSNPFQ